MMTTLTRKRQHRRSPSLHRKHERASIAYSSVLQEIDTVPEHPTSEELDPISPCSGFIGIIDPPRPEAKVAVHACARPVLSLL